MRLFISCDANWESRVDQILNELEESKYEERFGFLDFGSGLDCLAVIFVCRDPDLKFKPRIKIKKEKNAFRPRTVLYMDIMLDLDTMAGFGRTDRIFRKQIMAQRLYEEVPEVLSRYNLKNFDNAGFISAFRAWIDELGWRNLNKKDGSGTLPST